MESAHPCWLLDGVIGGTRAILFVIAISLNVVPDWLSAATAMTPALLKSSASTMLL